MSVIKRTRFEVLRRDSHTCQYCGRKAPDVPLHVDHVIPVALGGKDAPDNLVTACRECNTGKSSIAPDSPIVAAVGARSRDYAIANANRMVYLVADLEAIKEYENQFLVFWNGYEYTSDDINNKVALDYAWRNTLGAWWKRQVPLALIRSAVSAAMSAEHVQYSDRFRYFCGIVWRTLDDYENRYPEQTNAARVYSAEEVENAEVDAWDRGRAAATTSIADADFVRHHIDGTKPTPMFRAA